MTKKNDLILAPQNKGGVLCKEFNRVRMSDQLDFKIEQAYATEIVAGSRALQKCNPDTIARSMIDLAFMGLSLSPAMKEAYLIPYGTECTASPSYMGLVNILSRTGVLAPPYVETEVVRKGDRWREWADPIHGKMFEHEFGKERGDVTNVWAVFTLSNGTKKVVTMDQKAIAGCRDAAAKKNGGEIPWVWKGAFREEMYKKSCVRRGWKLLPKIRDPRVIAMLEALDRTDPVDFDDKVVAVNDPQTIGTEQIEELAGIIRSYGMTDDTWINRQLNGLAAGMGLPSLRKMPMEKFDTAVSLLREGLERWVQSSQSENSDSKQEDTTAQKEAV